MSSHFYNTIIEDEKKLFNIKDDALKIAAKDVDRAYNSSALKEGSTFLDYNNPRNRCAYLHKYSTLHTSLAAKYFNKLMTHETVSFILEQRKELKICCLGGGPGTDIVGVFKSLASKPSFHRKVTQVTVLDLCGGWRNSFKHVISKLKHGKVDGVPLGFIDSNNFKADLIEVNLLKPLPTNIQKIISTADIICMIKFVSAILGKEESVKALKVIGENSKLGALVLFIDNFYTKMFTTLEKVSVDTGYSITLGLNCDKFKCQVSKSKNNVYGCSPLCSTRVSVIGMIKSTQPSTVENQNRIPIHYTCKSNEENNDIWDTDSESEDSSAVIRDKCQKMSKVVAKTSCDKFSQTNREFSRKSQNRPDDISGYEELTELMALMEALSNVLSVIKRLKQNASKKQCCCRYQTRHCMMNNSCSRRFVASHLVSMTNYHN